MKKYFTYLLLAIAFISCKKDKSGNHQTNIPPIDTTIHLTLTAKNNPATVNFDMELKIAGDSITGVAPKPSNEKKFVLSFAPAGIKVQVNGTAQQSGITVNDFTKPLTYTITNLKGVTKTYKVAITNYTGIPIFYITTAAPVVSEDDYVTGSLSVNANGQFDQDTTSIALQIKGRGNSTWDMPKKPYRLKFNKKASLLGLTAAKNWVLLANYSDKTLLRNSVAFDMGHQFSSNFAPHYRFVEVIMNGVFLGNYNLTEQMEVNPGRVDITEMGTNDNAGDALTGGYLIELDQRLDADYTFYSNKGLPFDIHSPDAITTTQLNYIQGYVNQAEAAMFSDNFADPVNGYAKYIDVDSFIDWYLVKELMKDNDGQDFSSIYYYKERGGKLSMGPVWDFDLAAGNTNYSDCQYPTGWWIRNSLWFGRLFQDPAFAARAKQRWQAIKPTLPLIMANIDHNANYIDLSQQQNFTIWPILGTYVWPNVVVEGTYSGEVNYMKTWLQTRIAWMDANM